MLNFYYNRAYPCDSLPTFCLVPACPTAPPAMSYQRSLLPKTPSSGAAVGLPIYMACREQINKSPQIADHPKLSNTLNCPLHYTHPQTDARGLFPPGVLQRTKRRLLKFARMISCPICLHGVVCGTRSRREPKTTCRRE